MKINITWNFTEEDRRTIGDGELAKRDEIKGWILGIVQAALDDKYYDRQFQQQQQEDLKTNS